MIPTGWYIYISDIFRDIYWVMQNILKRKKQCQLISPSKTSFCNVVEKNLSQKNLLKIQNLSHQAQALEIFLRTLALILLNFLWQICSIFQQLLHCRSKPYESTTSVAPLTSSWGLSNWTKSKMEVAMWFEGSQMGWWIQQKLLYFSRKKKEKPPYI